MPLCGPGMATEQSSARIPRRGTYLDVLLQLLDDLQSIIQRATVADEPGDQLLLAVRVVSPGRPRAARGGFVAEIIGAILEIWRDNGRLVSVSGRPVDLNGGDRIIPNATTSITTNGYGD